MKIKQKALDFLSQIIALTEVKIKLKMKYKFSLIFLFLTPIVAVIMPLIVMGAFLRISGKLGPWTSENYVIFIFISYEVLLLRGIIDEFPHRLLEEKFWKTLTALMVAPFNRFCLLISIFLSHLILICIPMTIFFIVLLILYPISIFTALTIIMLIFLIAIVFSGIGLIIGVFAISKENIWHILKFGMNLIFWFSCVTYPYELFPSIIQSFINWNPLYYIFDFLRYTWLENNFILTLNSHFYEFLILVVMVIAIPSVGIIIFNKILKKYGITGY